MRGSSSVTSTTTDEGAPAALSGGVRRGILTGRALIGGLLVTMAALVVFAAYAGAEDRPSTSVVVARRDLDPGEVLAASDLEVRALSVPAEVAGRAFPDLDAVVGAVTLGPIGSGELVQQGSVRSADGSAAIQEPEFSFPVDRERALAGDVQAGESVDLLATFGSGSDARTEVVARGARVLHVQDSRNGTLGSSGRLVLTVGLASEIEVLEVAHASEVAVITVVRATGRVGTTTGATSSTTTPSTVPGGRR